MSTVKVKTKYGSFEVLQVISDDPTDDNQGVFNDLESLAKFLNGSSVQVNFLRMNDNTHWVVFTRGMRTDLTESQRERTLGEAIDQYL